MSSTHVPPPPRLHFSRPSSRVLPVVLALALAALWLGTGLVGASGRLPGANVEQVVQGCRVGRVIDGDTVDLACPGAGIERARLTGFDTPELFSPECEGERERASAAKLALEAMLRQAESLEVVRHGRDRYDRSLVALSVDGRPVAAQMIAAGMARPYDGGRRRGWCEAPRTARVEELRPSPGAGVTG